MDNERRKKVVNTNKTSATGNATNRSNVIRPHKRGEGSSNTAASSGTTAPTTNTAAASAPASNVVTVEQFIVSYLSGLKAGTLTDSVWGNSLSAKLPSARSLLSIPANDEVYLYSEVQVLFRGKVALALCASGLRMRDVSGTVRQIAWKDLRSHRIAAQGTTLAIGNYQLAFHDAAVLAQLLTQIQSKLA